MSSQTSIYSNLMLQLFKESCEKVNKLQIANNKLECKINVSSFISSKIVLLHEKIKRKRNSLKVKQ